MHIFQRSGSTPSSGTGPSSAFEGTSYKYVEVSSPVQNGDVATLVSSNALLAGKYHNICYKVCLQVFKEVDLG